MKRGWLALALIIAAVAICTAEYIYIGTGTQICVDMLTEADELMAHSEAAQAQELTRRLDNRFSSQKGMYDIFLFHSEVVDVSAGLAALREYARTGDVSEFLAASARVKRTLISMRDSLLPRAENVL